MSRPLPKLLILALQGLLISIIVAVMLATFFVTMPMAETRYFPVVETLQIDRVEPAAEDRSAVYGTFNKVRACEYMGISWFKRNSNGVLEQVSIELLRRPGDTSSPNRPLGRQTAGPWVIGIPEEELRGTSVVELYHRCHPFWTTTTRFYP